MENRKYPRKTYYTPVEFSSPGWPYRRTIENISEDGMLVRTRDIISPGTELKFLFDLKGSFIRIKGKVVWTRIDCLGIQFIPGVEKNSLPNLVNKIPEA